MVNTVIVMNMVLAMRVKEDEDNGKVYKNHMNDKKNKDHVDNSVIK